MRNQYITAEGQRETSWWTRVTPEGSDRESGTLLTAFSIQIGVNRTRPRFRRMKTKI